MVTDLTVRSLSIISSKEKRDEDLDKKSSSTCVSSGFVPVSSGTGGS